MIDKSSFKRDSFSFTLLAILSIKSVEEIEGSTIDSKSSVVRKSVTPSDNRRIISFLKSSIS